MAEQRQPIVDIKTRRRRVIYRADHRGTKELDFMLGRYCKAHVDGFDAKRLAIFETLMDQEETELQQWLMGQVATPSGELGAMLDEIRNFHLSGGGWAKDMKQ